MSKRKRSQDLPDDIVFEILIRLEADATTLHKLRCVSRQWYHIICRPLFQEEDYRRRCQRSSLLLETLHDPPNRIISFNIYSNDRNLVNEFSFKVPRSIQDSNFHMIQSFRGLVCFTPFLCEQILLCNPSTSEQLVLPISSTNKFSECVCVGFGFSESTKKIKVFRFIFRSVDNSCLSEVFTLGTSHSWRTASPPPYMPRFHAPLLHGALHLIPLPRQVVQVVLDHYIAVLDVDTEEYRQISLPDVYFGKASCLMEENDRLRLVELRGYLCLAFDFWETEKNLEIWFLTDYLGGKWEKKYTIDLSSIVSCNGAFPLAIMDDECILLDVALWIFNELIFYNPQGQCFSRMNRRNFLARLYCESLFGLTRTGFNESDAAILPLGNANLQQRLRLNGTNDATLAAEQPNQPGRLDGHYQNEDLPDQSDSPDGHYQNEDLPDQHYQNEDLLDQHYQNEDLPDQPDSPDGHDHQNEDLPDQPDSPDGHDWSEDLSQPGSLVGHDQRNEDLPNQPDRPEGHDRNEDLPNQPDRPDGHE